MALDKMGARTMEASAAAVSEKTQSDHALIEATKNGDEASFASIVGRY